MTDKDLEKIKKILESCHINFLIGSGASKNYLDELKNVENLLSDIQKKINLEPNNESYKVIVCSIKYNYFSKCIRGNLAFIDNDISDKKIDEFNETSKNYIEFISALNSILTRRKTNIISKQINLFTTNMDLFLDDTLEKLNIEFNDGFYGRQNPVFSTSNFKKSIYQVSAHYDNKTELPTFNLFKMHGAVNWTQKNGNIYHDGYLSNLSKLNTIKIETENLIEIIENDSIDNLIEKAKTKKLKKEIEEFLLVYNDLVMVNPTKEKFALTTIDYNFYEQLRMYSNALEKENSVLFVSSFSFEDEHIREITQRVAKSNPTFIIYILCYSENGKNKILGDKYSPQNSFTNVFALNLKSKFGFKEQIESIFKKLSIEIDDKYFLVEEKTKELKGQQNKETKTETTNGEG